MTSKQGEPMMEDRTTELFKRIENDFKHHPPPNEDIAQLYAENRKAFLALAQYVVTNTPASREQSLALEKLEEAMFWTNAAVARNADIYLKISS